MLIDEQIKRNIDRLPIPFNVYGVDPFGVSKKYLATFYTPFAYMYRHYLRVTSFGTEHIPARGSALIVANHGGGIGTDAAMISTSLLLNDDNPRLGHGMAEYFFQKWPFVSPIMSRVGHLAGIPEHGERLLEAGRIVIVFPEGARGTGKLYRDRYQLVRFGTGFMRLALKTQTPIIPTAFVGGEEAFPTMFHIKSLAKLVGLPYIPVAPQLMMFPVPISCQIYFGSPMHFEGDGSEPDNVIDAYIAEVRDRITKLIEIGRKRRTSPFSLARMPESPALTTQEHKP